MHNPTDRITHTTAFVAPVVEHWLEREIAQWVDPTTHRTMSERSYHGATARSEGERKLVEVGLPTVREYATNVIQSYDISRSSQCSTTCVTKAVVCVILSVGWCI